MLRRAWRRLLDTPVFTTFAVLSLALGVGVTTAIYSVVLFITRTNLDVPDPDRIAFVTGSDGRHQSARSVMSRADFDDLARSATSLGPLAASATFYQALVGDSVSRLAIGEAVSGEYFSHLQLSPARGRLILPADDTAPSRVAVVSHQFWQVHLAADERVLDQVLRIGGEPFAIVGVAPEGFSGVAADFSELATAVWVPLGSTSMFPSSAKPPDDPADRRRRQLTVLVRLPQPDAIGPLAAEVAGIGRRLDADHPIDMRPAPDAAPIRQPRNWSLRSAADVASGSQGMFGRSRLLITAIVALVLVVACTNLANLVLARGSTRVHELAVRRALGASRTRLVLDQLCETGLVAAMGGLGAWLVARVLILMFGSITLPVSNHQVVQLAPVLDVPSLVLAGASLIVALAVFGVAPAWHLSRGDVRPALTVEGGGTGDVRWRTKRVLIAVQVMISLAFFLIAAFTARVATIERSGSSGVDVDRLAIASLNFSLPPWTETTTRDVVDRLASVPADATPGIESLAVASGMPFGVFAPVGEFTVPEKPFAPGRSDYPGGQVLAATPRIFETLGVPIVSGRALDARDTSSAPSVAVVSELAARQIYGTTAVLGRALSIRMRGEPDPNRAISSATIVGVAADTDTQERYSRRIGTVYRPIAQHYHPALTLVARASADPEAIIPALRTLVRNVDPNLVLDRPGPARDHVMGAYVMLGVIASVAGWLALLALLISMAGLFGVISHLVARRTREIGVRLALGADTGQILRLVLRDGLRPVGSGIVMGFILGILARWLFLLAYHSSVTLADIVVFALAPLPIIAAAVFACYWPARRAARVQPNVALRDL